MDASTELTGIDHINISMPKGEEAIADRFYVDLLGLVIRPKPRSDAEGRWYVGSGFEVHLGADPDFVPASRAHPAFVVRGLGPLVGEIERFGNEVDKEFEGDKLVRAIIFDPFGNRIELLAS